MFVLYCAWYNVDSFLFFHFLFLLGAGTDEGTRRRGIVALWGQSGKVDSWDLCYREALESLFTVLANFCYYHCCSTASSAGDFLASAELGLSVACQARRRCELSVKTTSKYRGWEGGGAFFLRRCCNQLVNTRGCTKQLKLLLPAAANCIDNHLMEGASPIRCQASRSSLSRHCRHTSS